LQHTDTARSEQHAVQTAFNRHAKTYDERFSNSILGESLRSNVWDIADEAFASCLELLDLGAGTGEDAIHFARNGVRVTAVDVSPGMMTRLTEKAARAGVSSRIKSVLCEIDRYSPQECLYDGLISNFGALNCIRDLSWLRDTARNGLRPGAKVVLVTMGRFYPLEWIIFALKGQFLQAFRRFRNPCEVCVEGTKLNVHYHSLRNLRSMLEPQFQLEQITGLRAFLPVPGWEHLAHAASFRSLRKIDEIWCRFRFTAQCADHFMTVWRYRP
jgi:ubiquinone/menaquinone biosynthesis C-methylase UbiE